MFVVELEMGSESATLPYPSIADLLDDEDLKGLFAVEDLVTDCKVYKLIPQQIAGLPRMEWSLLEEALCRPK